MRRNLLVTIAAALALAFAAAPAQAAPEDPPPGANDFACTPSAQHPNPVILLHGLGANMRENWQYHSPRIKAAGYCVFALTYGVDGRTAAWPYRPGGSIRMEESAEQLDAFVNGIRAATGATKVDLVGHSEGTVMPRWYLERLGGAAHVERFVSLTPLWRGTEVGGAAILRDAAGPERSAPFVSLAASLCGSCPQFLRGSDYLNDLNADGEAVAGIEHTNVVTRYDELVVPYTSGIMQDGGTNFVLQELCPANTSDHMGVAFDPVVTRLILNALDPASTGPVECVGGGS